MKHHTFEWRGRHPAIDFVNTLDERLSPAPIEHLASYAALVEFARQAQLIEDSTAARLILHRDSAAAKRIWSRGIRLREALLVALQAIIAHQQPHEAPVAYIESTIHEATAARRLIVGESDCVWLWREPDAPERPLWELALAAESLLVSGRVERIKQCAAHDCGVLFVDESRAGSRRWCSMAGCGNRQKVRRFRATQRESN